MKKTFIIASIVVLIAAGVVAAIILTRDSSADNNKNQSSSTNTNKSDDSDKTPTGGVATTKEGTFQCLTMPDNGEPQTLECAFGLKADDGTQYAIRTDDAPNLNTVPMGTRIRVTGPMTEETTKYNTAGTIRVESYEQL